MKSESKVLSARIFNSKVRSQNVTSQERWLGYLLGPCGAVLLNAVPTSWVRAVRCS